MKIGCEKPSLSENLRNRSIDHMGCIIYIVGQKLTVQNSFSMSDHAQESKVVDADKKKEPEPDTMQGTP